MSKMREARPLRVPGRDRDYESSDDSDLESNEKTANHNGGMQSSNGRASGREKQGSVIYFSNSMGFVTKFTDLN
jgi:hypothetical protein